MWVLLFAVHCSANSLTAINSPLLNGVFFGLQADPANPSNCAKSFDSVDSSYSVFVSTLDSLEISEVYPLIIEFNNLVNQFVASFDICSFNSFLSNYFTDSETAILNLLINITGNFKELSQAVNNLVLAYALGADSYDIGVALGTVIRYLTGLSF